MDTDSSPLKVKLEVRRGDETNNSYGFYNDNSHEAYVSVGVEYSIGAPKGLDCDKLYQKELTIRDLQVKQLQEQLKQLQHKSDIIWEE
jgi:hypothetical protein